MLLKLSVSVYGLVLDLLQHFLSKVQLLSLIAIFPQLLRNILTEIQQKTTNKDPLVLVWMMATLEPIPATYGHRAWLRAHKCYSPWTLCQPMAHRINGQFRAGGQACPQHYMAWVWRARRQRNTPQIQGHSQPGTPFLRKLSTVRESVTKIRFRHRFMYIIESLIN